MKAMKCICCFGSRQQSHYGSLCWVVDVPRTQQRSFSAQCSCWNVKKRETSMIIDRKWNSSQHSPILTPRKSAFCCSITAIEGTASTSLTTDEISRGVTAVTAWLLFFIVSQLLLLIAIVLLLMCWLFPVLFSTHDELSAVVPVSPADDSFPLCSVLSSGLPLLLCVVELRACISHFCSCLISSWWSWKWERRANQLYHSFCLLLLPERLNNEINVQTQSYLILFHIMNKCILHVKSWAHEIFSAVNVEPRSFFTEDFIGIKTLSFAICAHRTLRINLLIEMEM